MELQDFIANFAEQFEDTDPTEIMADTNYQDLDEWDSMTTLSVIAFIKTIYGKSVTGKEIRSCETVQDLFDLVSLK